MPLFSDRDLYLLVRNKKLFDVFKLSERERLVVKMRVNGFPYEHIGALNGRVTAARARQIYNRALRKMKEQIIEALKAKAERPAPANPPQLIAVRYIAGNGVSGNGDFLGRVG
jgi:hypothetical protein